MKTSLTSWSTEGYLQVKNYSDTNISPYPRLYFQIKISINLITLNVTCDE